MDEEVTLYPIEKALEHLADCIETFDNLIAAFQLPIPDDLRVRALKEAMPELRDKVKAAYFEAGGEDFWDI